MTRRWCWISAALALALASPASAQPASAQQKSDADAKAAARVLANTGLKRFDAGDYAGAIDAFRDAEKYFHAPTIVNMIAVAHEKLGKLLEARELHKQVVEEKLPANATIELAGAQKDSKKALESLETRIPKAQITLASAPPGTRVTLDGKALDAAALAQPIPLDPGKHALVVEPPGAPKVTREFELKEQAVETIRIELGAPQAVPEPEPPAAPSATAPSSSRSMVGPFAAFGAGGVGLVLGAVMGGVTLSKAGEIREICGEDLVCPEGARSKIDLEGSKTFGYVSTVGFVVAGVGAAVGVVLLLWPGAKKQDPAAAALTIGPGFLGVKGAF